MSERIPDTSPHTKGAAGAKTKLDPDREALIEEILRAEFRMFQEVNAVARAPCQDDPQGFRLYRRAQFAVWSTETLLSYLEDLKAARCGGRNLLHEKYARMDNLVPPLSGNPLIGAIVHIQAAWQVELVCKYPRLMAKARPISDAKSGTCSKSFETYLRSELETYSDRTLFSLYQDIEAGMTRNCNLCEEVYLHVVRDLGYGSIEEAEDTLRAGPTP